MRLALRAALAALLLLARPGLAAAALPPLELPPVDIQGALAVDALKPGPQPFRFAVPINVDLSPERAGEWQTAADGSRVWTLTVHAAGASSLNFGFTRYRLPPGAELFVQTADGRDRRGPYTDAHNTLGQLWTPVVRSDRARIELHIPAGNRAPVLLGLGVINHGFRGFGAKDSTPGAKSGSCNIDVVCSDGDDWRDEIRSVARYTIAGALLCTGQLVNNTAQDFKPYFLTANHCVTTAAEAPTTAFYWNYQTSKCGGAPDGSLEQTQSGALLVAASGGFTEVGSDFTLLQLLTTPDPAFKVYYSGWDRRDIAPIGVVGIHHPNGDEKRISKDFDQTFVAAYGYQPEDPQTTLQPTHLMIRTWDRGVTEGGSSGSGIWNLEHRLVGQLSGGGSSCDAPTEPDWYGRMYANFDNVPTPATSLDFWLDPSGSGAEVLDGADPAEAGSGSSSSSSGGSTSGGSTSGSSSGSGSGSSGSGSGSSSGGSTGSSSSGSSSSGGSSSGSGGGSGSGGTGSDNGGGAFGLGLLVMLAGWRRRRATLSR